MNANAQNNRGHRQLAMAANLTLLGAMTQWTAKALTICAIFACSLAWPLAMQAVPANGENRESGSLVKDFQRLNQEFNNAQQAAEQLSENTEAAGGKEALNAAHEAMMRGEDEKVAETYAAEMAAGRGPNYWQKQREEFAGKEKDFFNLYDQLKDVWHEARRARTEGNDQSSVSMLDELNKQMSSDRSSKASTRLRVALASAKKERDEKFKKVLEISPYAGLYTGSLKNLPPDVIESIMVSVVEKAVEMGDAAASAERAEIWMRSIEDTLRARAKQKAVQEPGSVNGKPVKKGLF